MVRTGNRGECPDQLLFSIVDLPYEMLRENQHDSPANVEIFNPLGQEVYSTSFSIQHSKLNIDFSSQSAGIYFVKVQTAEKIFTQKLVIQ